MALQTLHGKDGDFDSGSFEVQKQPKSTWSPLQVAFKRM